MLSLHLIWLSHHSGRCPGLGPGAGMRSHSCSAHPLAPPPPRSSSAPAGTRGDIHHPPSLSFLVCKMIFKTRTSQSCLLNKKKDTESHPEQCVTHGMQSVNSSLYCYFAEIIAKWSLYLCRLVVQSLSSVRFFATPWTACGPPGFPALHCLLEFAQAHLH